MNELIKVDYSSERPTVSARELHRFLEIKTEFRHWFPECVSMALLKVLIIPSSFLSTPKISNHLKTIN